MSNTYILFPKVENTNKGLIDALERLIAYSLLRKYMVKGDKVDGIIRPTVIKTKRYF